MRLPNLIGQHFGKLLVTSNAGRNKYGKTVWRCLCSCGGERIVSTNHLQGRWVRSCGCLRIRGHKLCHLYDNFCYSRTEYSGRRRLVNVRQMPRWACEFTMAVIYETAKKANLVVDHIVPLRGINVCGLHCEDNLSCISYRANSTKGIKYASITNIGVR